MSGRISGIVSLLAVAIASPITIGAGLVLYEAASPPERSLVTSIMGRIGEGESAQADAAREAEARYQFRLTQAQEENRRVTAAYTRLYNALGASLQKAFELEAEIVRIQARNVDETQWARKLGTNVADVGCMLSMLSPDSGLDEACSASQALRQDMVGQYREVLPSARPGLVSEMMSDFIHPDDFLKPEYERAADEFGEGFE